MCGVGGLLGVLVMNNSILLYMTFTVPVDRGVQGVVVSCFLFPWAEQTGGFVGWEPHSEREHYFIRCVWCKLSAY